MKKMNEMEEKPIKVTETDLEQVAGGVTLRELMQEACQQTKDLVEKNSLKSKAFSYGTRVARK